MSNILTRLTFSLRTRLERVVFSVSIFSRRIVFFVLTQGTVSLKTYRIFRQMANNIEKYVAFPSCFCFPCEILVRPCHGQRQWNKSLECVFSQTSSSEMTLYGH